MMSPSAQNVERDSVRALAQPISTQQEKTVLDLLIDGVFVAEVLEQASSKEPKFKLLFVNKAMKSFMQLSGVDLTDQNMTTLFCNQRYPQLYEALRQTVMLEARHDLEMVVAREEESLHLKVTLKPARGVQFGGSNSEQQVIGCVSDVTTLTTRATYLEDRAVKLMDHANVVETSRLDLQREVVRLRDAVDLMEKSRHFDNLTGLPNRSYFLDRASAEFQRSRRYEHHLSLVVLSVQGMSAIFRQHGQEGADSALTGLAEVCETASRAGTDLTGRIGKTEIAVLLPETALAGALQFVERLRALISKTPIHLGEGYARLGVISSIDTIQSDDHTIMQAMARAQEALED